MANNKSAKKRIRVNKRNNIQNNSYKSLIKSSEKRHLKLIKQYQNEVSNSDQSNLSNLKVELQNSFNYLISRIDRAAKKNVIHKNTAIRKKKKIFTKTFLFNK